MRLTLRNKLLFFFIVLAIIPLVVAGWNMIIISQNELKSAANDELGTVALQVSKEIDNSFINTWMAPLMLIRNGFDNDQMGVEEKISLFYSINEISDIVSLQLTVEGAPEPVMVVRDNFKNRLLNKSLDPALVLQVTPGETSRFFQHPAGTPALGQITSGDLKYVKVIDTWLLTVNIRLRKKIMDRSAVLSARINLNRLRDNIRNHPFTKTGYIIVVDKTGKKMFDPAFTDLSRLKIVKPAIGLMNSGARTIGAFPYTQLSGERMLGAFSFSTHFKWAVIASKTEAAAYQSITGMLRSLAFWVFSGFLVALAAGVFFSRRISKPILGIGAVAGIVGTGHLDVKVAKLKSNDEISDLGRQINKMIDGLREKTRLEIFNKKLKDLNDQLTVKNDEIENANQQLSVQNEKIKKQHNIIDIKNRMITSSINYALEIQKAVIPLKEDLIEGFPGHFVIYKPKDIVSGDFYWYHKIGEERFVIAVADCTGHGVPGGFISMVGNLLLNKIVGEEHIYEPGKILDALDAEVRHFFKQEAGKLQDGMDICLCLLDRGTRKLSFAGARRPLYIIKKPPKKPPAGDADDQAFEELEEIKGTRKSIGGWHRKKAGIGFRTHEFELDEIDLIYLSTDGFADQFNPRDKRFGSRRLKRVLQEIYHMGIETQGNILTESLVTWKQDEPQCDDITLIGIKL